MKKQGTPSTFQFHEMFPDEAKTLQGFVTDRTADDVVVYTDEATACKGIARTHDSVNHGSGEYVRNDASTNGMESFWANFKRGYVGTFHYMSEKHLQRYVDEFQARNNLSNNAADFMAYTARRFEGRLLTHKQLAGGVQ